MGVSVTNASLEGEKALPPHATAFTIPDKWKEYAHQRDHPRGGELQFPADANSDGKTRQEYRSPTIDADKNSRSTPYIYYTRIKYHSTREQYRTLARLSRALTRLLPSREEASAKNYNPSRPGASTFARRSCYFRFNRNEGLRYSCVSHRTARPGGKRTPLHQAAGSTSTVPDL